jgi:hypothetical protein
VLIKKECLMFEVESVDREVMATESFAVLSDLGHDFRYGDGHIGGGGGVATRRGVSCTLCGHRFEFKRVSERVWRLDEYSTEMSRFSCADFRDQNLRIRRRWAQLIASWSKNQKDSGLASN